MKHRTGTFYLNNSETRWVVYESDGHKPLHGFQTKSGNSVFRRAIFYENFGNFASLCINYKGKRIMVLPDTTLED